MTRAKSKPAVHKPVFDAESILRFASLGADPVGGELRHVAEDADCTVLSLKLKATVISRLQAEAARKEKTIDQVVEKLVTKHLGKH